MAEPLRHRQTKEAATDMFGLKPPRHISTLPVKLRPRSCLSIQSALPRTAGHSLRVPPFRLLANRGSSHPVASSSAAWLTPIQSDQDCSDSADAETLQAVRERGLHVSERNPAHEREQDIVEQPQQYRPMLSGWSCCRGIIRPVGEALFAPGVAAQTLDDGAVLIGNS
jgi:hypothetical protein